MDNSSHVRIRPMDYRFNEGLWGNLILWFISDTLCDASAERQSARLFWGDATPRRAGRIRLRSGLDGEEGDVDVRSWVRAIDPWLVVGAALCWTSTSLRLTNGAACAYVPAIGLAALPVALGMALAWGIGAFALLSHVRGGKARVGLASLLLVASVALLACDVAAPTLSVPAGAAVLCVAALVAGVSAVMWAAAFATLGSRIAPGNAMMTLLGSAVLVLALLGASVLVPLTWGADVCSVGAAALLLSGRAPLRIQGRRRRPCPAATIAALVAQRLVWGCLLGLFAAVFLAVGRSGGAVGGGGADWVLLAFALVALVAVGVIAARVNVPLPTTLPAVVLAALALLCLPALDGDAGPAGSGASMIGALILAGQVAFSAQLAGLKRYLGLSELEVAFADRALCALGMAAGALVGALVCGVGGAALDATGGAGTLASGSGASLSPAAPPFGAPTAPIAGDGSGVALPGGAAAWTAGLLVALSVCVLGAALSLARLAGVRQERTRRYLAERAAAEERAGEGPRSQSRLLDDIADEYDLTPREREVFVLLAQGYTGGFIASEIGVALGTVKAHAAHIYQKLGVTHRDAMLELVERRATGR